MVMTRWNTQKFASHAGVATFATAYCSVFMSRLNRDCAPGDLFMTIALSVAALFAVLLLFRIPWQFVCDRIDAHNYENANFTRKLLSIFKYDVIPMTLIVAAVCYFDFHIEYLALPVITILFIALILKNSDEGCFSKKIQLSYFVLNAALFFVIGIFVSTGSNVQATLALVFARFMAVAFPVTLLFKNSKLFYLPALIIVSEKMLYGNFSTLDILFIPCNFLISAVFAFYCGKKLPQ